MRSYDGGKRYEGARNGSVIRPVNFPQSSGVRAIAMVQGHKP
jgi:hypothetical protein